MGKTGLQVNIYIYMVIHIWLYSAVCASRCVETNDISLVRFLKIIGHGQLGSPGSVLGKCC